MKRFLPMPALLTILLLNGCGGGEETPAPPFEGARPALRNSSKWIARAAEYRPAPGQFINEAFCGTPEAAERIVGPAPGTLSLGGFGGYVVFMFDHTVVNGDGADFVILGNSFSGSSEPGVVRVAFDDNGNGLPDDAWYELTGEDHGLPTTLHGYSTTYSRPSQTVSAEAIAWEDNSGNHGETPVVPAHRQSYWPSFVGEAATLTFTGTRLGGLASQSESGQWVARAAGRGYADNYSDDYDEAAGGDPDTRGGNKFDISNAADASGRPVHLRGIDFIKVYTATCESLGIVGETSTEVCGAVSMTINRQQYGR
jgi:hypothetical protein